VLLQTALKTGQVIPALPGFCIAPSRLVVSKGIAPAAAEFSRVSCGQVTLYFKSAMKERFWISVRKSLWLEHAPPHEDLESGQSIQRL
jgi:hypothetical protein